jgi:hypothetical protein
MAQPIPRNRGQGDRAAGVIGSSAGRTGTRDAGLEAMLARVRRAEARRDRRQLRSSGLAAGGLLIAMWLFAVPSSLLLEDGPTLGAYLVPMVGICTGLICLTIPWGRIARGWLHLVIVATTAEIATWVALTDLSYGAYYALVAAYAGYALPRRGRAAAQTALIVVAVGAPLLYEPDPGVAASNALLIAPLVGLLSAMAAWARGQVEAMRRRHRQFAVEALGLVVRIGGEGLAPQPSEDSSRDSAPHASELLANELRRRARRAPRRMGRLHVRPHPAALLSVVVLGLPLAVAGFAAAGVSMPDSLRTPFDAVNVALPNQGPVSTSGGSAPPRPAMGADLSGDPPSSNAGPNVSVTRQRPTGTRDPGPRSSSRIQPASQSAEVPAAGKAEARAADEGVAPGDTGPTATATALPPQALALVPLWGSPALPGATRQSPVPSDPGAVPGAPAQLTPNPPPPWVPGPLGSSPGPP